MTLAISGEYVQQEARSKACVHRMCKHCSSRCAKV